MSPQTLAAVGTVIAFVAGILASRGLISRETADYLASPGVLAVISTVVTAAIAVYGVVINLPKTQQKRVVASDPQGTAAALAQSDPHAVVAAAASVPGVSTIVAVPQIADAVPSGKMVTSAAPGALL